MKKLLSFALALAMLVSLCCLPVSAADSSQSYDFALTADGQSALEVRPGSSFNVAVDLTCTSASGDYTMFAADYVLEFSTKFFTLDASSITLDTADSRGVTCRYSESGTTGKLTVSVKSADFEGASWTNPSKLFSMTLTSTGVLGAASLRCTSAAMGTISGNKYESSNNNVIVTVANERQETTPTPTPTPTPSATPAPTVTPTTTPATSPSSSPSSSTSVSGGGAAGGTSTPVPTTPVAATTSTKTENPFKDVDTGDWYYDAALYVYNNGLFVGNTEGEFMPEGNMTRAMFVTVMNNYCEKPSPNGNSAFSDVASSAWYASQVNWAYENGIVNGTGENKFTPEREITLQEMMQVLYNYCGGKPASSVPTKYGTIASWAKNAMSWADSIGLFSGVQGSLSASGGATRAQIAKVMQNLRSAMLPCSFDETFVSDAMTADEFASSIRSALHSGTTSLTFTYTDGQYKTKDDITLDALRSGLDTACEDYAQYATFYAGFNANIQEVKGGWSIVVTLTPENGMTQAQLQAGIAAFDSKIAGIVASLKADGTITSGMTNLELARALYDYVAANYKYDTSYSGATAYKCLTDGKAVCEGYTSIYNALCQHCGIPMKACFGYSGKGVLHEWSEMLVNGSTAYFDVTFNSSTAEDGTPWYFNVSWEELQSLDKGRSLRSYWA